MKQKIYGYTSVGQTTTTTQLTDLQLALQDLDNHFHIRKGEKWTNPNFGSNLPYYVFQPLDEITLDLIEKDVRDVINYDPRFELLQEEVIVEDDGHTVTVQTKIRYLPTTVATDLIIKFDKEFESGEF